jgi:hypothetical protein
MAKTERNACGLNLRNSYFDGHEWPEILHGHAVTSDRFDWDNAWVDDGPSPAGNQGPYVKLRFIPEDTVHRLYPKDGAKISKPTKAK